MPTVVDAVLADAQLASRVEFVIQANFTFRLPCRRRNLPIVAAREALERHAPAQVQLLREPLDEAAYRRLILDADLFVLPYDARHYFARCSGVLIEALGAGIPAIVPANCWMGEQVARAAAPNAATGDVPPGLVANRPDEIPLLVRRIVDDYDRYRAAAAKFAVAWTRWHHPTRVIAEMLSGAATLDAVGPRSHPHAPPLADRRSA